MSNFQLPAFTIVGTCHKRWRREGISIGLRSGELGVQHLAGARRFGKTCEQGLLFG